MQITEAHRDIIEDNPAQLHQARLPSQLPTTGGPPAARPRLGTTP